MDFTEIIVFIKNNLEYFDQKDIKLIVNGQYKQFLARLNNKYKKESNDEINKKYEKIADFFTKVFQDYKLNSYKYSYNNAIEFEHYKYWFDLYMEKNLIYKAGKVLEDIKSNCKNSKKIEKLVKIYNRKKNKYESKYQDIKMEMQKRKDLKTIQNLINSRQYTKAMRKCLNYVQKYDDEKEIQSYINQINKIKENNLLQNIETSKEFFEKIGILENMEGLDFDSKEEHKEKLQKIYKALKNLYKDQNYDDGLNLISSIVEKYELQDKKLLKYKKKFIKQKRKHEKQKQHNDYKLEFKSLNLLMENKKYQDALHKANNILRKYPLVDKKKVLSIIKKIKKKKDKNIKNAGSKESKIDKFFIKISTLNKKGLNKFYNKMAWFLSANMDLRVTLQTIYAQTKDYGLKGFLVDLLEGIDSGMKISDILKWYKHTSDLDISLVKIGEKTGKMGEMFKTISKNKKESTKRKKKIRSVMMYPIIVIMITIIIFILMLVFVFPKFIQMFDQIGIEMPLLTKIMLNMSDGFVNYRYYILAGVVMIIVGIRYFATTKPGEYFFSWLFLKMPVVKTMVYRYYMIYFASNLSMMLKAGISLLDALDIMSEGASNMFFKNEFKRIRFELEAGVTFSKAVGLGDMESIANYSNKYLPIDMAYAIDIGEKTGQLSKTLNDSAKQYEQDLENIIKNLQSLMEPFIIILVGGIVFLFVLSIFLPMMKMYQGIGNM